MCNSEEKVLSKDKESSEENPTSFSANDNTDTSKSTEESAKKDDPEEKSLKRDTPDNNKDDESSKRHKSDDPPQSSFLDILKSVVKDTGSNSDPFNVLTNTKEYDCPIAKLAQIDPGTSFLRPQDPPYPTPDPPSEATEEAEDGKDSDNQVVLDSSIADNEELLHETKECKLSVYKDSEWTVPVPDSGNKRLVCFQSGTGRLLLNTAFLPSMSFNKLKSKSIIFSGQTLGDNPVLIPHRLLFPSTSVRDEFHELFSG